MLSAASSAREEKKGSSRGAARRARPRRRRGQAARRWRAHPLGSAHAGEGAGDGAMAARSTASLARLLLATLRREAKREKGQEENDARVSAEVLRSPFLSVETHAWPSDLHQRCRGDGTEAGPGRRERASRFPNQA